MHYDGELYREDKGGYGFRDTLSETLRFLGQDNPKEVRINLNDSLVDKVTFSLQGFIYLCGGREGRTAD